MDSATSKVRSAVVPSGIRSEAITKSPSMTSAKVVLTMPAGKRETLKMSVPTAPEIITIGRSTE